jgi:hypothetical protein
MSGVLLEQSLAQAQRKVCIVDFVAEPGMGKSRLPYEFRRRISDGQTFLPAWKPLAGRQAAGVTDLHRGAIADFW